MSYLQHREQKNKDFLQTQIDLKNSSNPYFADQQIYSVRNEYNQFPYPFWYKGGNPENPNPTIDNRDAGWIPKGTYTKVQVKQEKAPKPKVFFETPCSIIYPAYRELNTYAVTNEKCFYDRYNGY
jgi:hypothetical protein